MPIYPLNHVNLNIHIYDPIETDEGSFGQYSNTIGFNVSGHTITEKLTLSGYQTNTYLQPQLKIKRSLRLAFVGTNKSWRKRHLQNT